MIIEKIGQGYWSEQLKVTAEDGEILTKEMVEEKFSFPFGCIVRGQAPTFYVDNYLD